jgi:hypothetical protein
MRWQGSVIHRLTVRNFPMRYKCWSILMLIYLLLRYVFLHPEVAVILFLHPEVAVILQERRVTSDLIEQHLNRVSLLMK